MYWTPEKRCRFLAAVALSHKLPDSDTVWWEINGDRLGLQASNQAELRELRKLFPGAIWRKLYNEFCGWWEYITEYQGADVRIYGINETPPTCRLVEETYTVTEKVPTAYVEREVTKTRLRPECGPEASHD